MPASLRGATRWGGPVEQAAGLPLREVTAKRVTAVFYRQSGCGRRSTDLTFRCRLGSRRRHFVWKVAAVAEQPSQRPWSVEIYQVLDHNHQQRILHVFRELAHPNVIALGTQSGHDWFVVIEVSSLADRVFAHRTICAIDRHATRTYSSGRPQLAGPLPAS